MLNNEKINKLGLLLLGIQKHLPEKFNNYLTYYENWDAHLFNKVNHFVQVVPKDINVKIGIEDGTKLCITSKPILLDFENPKLEINENDFEFLDYLNNAGRIFPLSHKYSEIKSFLETYEICVQFEKIEYFTTLILPKKEFIFENIKAYSLPKSGGYGVCIDGIGIDRDNSIGIDNYYTHALSGDGIINFIGELRPQLSVDRTSIIEYPNECEKAAEEISKILLKKILNTAKKHIEVNDFDTESNELNLIWEYTFEKIGFDDILFINELSYTEYGDIKWQKLNEKLIEKKSIRDFLISDSIQINNFSILNVDILTKKLLLAKLISAKEINVKGSNINILQQSLVKSNLIQKRNSLSEHDLLISVDSWRIFDENFDIVSNMYPLVPKRLFNLLDKPHIKKETDKIKIVRSLSNGITAFFSQNPLLINEKLGLYIEGSGSFGKKENNIYNFENKRSKIELFELNDRFS